MTNLSTRTMTRIMAPSRGDVRDWMHIFREYDGDNLVFVENEIKKKVNLADVISYAAIEYNDEALLEVPPCALFPNTYDALVNGITDVPLDIELDMSSTSCVMRDIIQAFDDFDDVHGIPALYV